MKQVGNCGNCARGMKISVNRDILCKINGIVSRDFRCAKYIRRVEAWTAQEIKPKCIECEFFTVPPAEPGHESEYDPASGFCQLFTVRQFNGEHKSACSKFCHKTEKNIS